MKHLAKIFLLSSLIIFSSGFSQMSRDKMQEQFIKDFTTVITSKYVSQRESIQLSESLRTELAALKSVYGAKLAELSAENITTSNNLDFYRAYPDVMAVLLNRNGQFAKPLSDNQKTEISALLNNIWKKIPNAVYEKASIATDAINGDKFHLTFPYDFEIYRDYFDGSSRKRNDIINFLLWKLN